MCLLSIVILVQEVKFLGRCIDSIVYNKKALNNIEVIIVSNNKTTLSAKVRDRIRQYPCVSLISKHNIGDALDIAFTKANGKYLKFMRSNDWINIDEFSAYVDSLGSTNHDLILTSFREENILTSQSTLINIQQAISYHKYSINSITVRTKYIAKQWKKSSLTLNHEYELQYIIKVLANAKTEQVLPYDIDRHFLFCMTEDKKTPLGFKELQTILTSTIPLEERSKNQYKSIILDKLKHTISNYYESYYRIIKPNKNDLRSILTFDKWLNNAYPDLHQQIPASAHLRLRLSPFYRKLKHIVLSR